MRVYQPCCVAVLAAITLMLTANVSAQDGSIVPVTLNAVVQNETSAASSTVTLQQRMDRIESQMAMINAGPSTGAASNSCCPIPSSRISTNSLRNPRHYAGFELAVLQAYTGSIAGAIPAFGVPQGTLTPEYDYDVGTRMYVGREGCNGLGFRFTYFQIDQKTDDVGAFGITSKLDIDSIDLELTSRTEFCGSDVTVSAGFRYGDLDAAYNVPGFGAITFESDGVGPTISGQLQRHLGQTQWDLVIGARGSLLLTDTDIDIPGLITVNATDSTMQIWEARIATQRTRCLKNGALLVTEMGFEAQNWQSGSILGLISPNFALAGPTFRIGLNF